MTGIVPGKYQVTAELQGFKKFERRELPLEVGKTMTHRGQHGGRRRSSETVNVTTESPLVDVTSKEIGGNITSETLTQLPSVNGNFIGFIGLLPGIVPSISTESFGSDSISVNGQDPRNNNYSVDGGNNNDDVIGQRAGMQARTPIEAIQEFQVITNQFDAEFGRTSGAVVNAVTKSGTNNLRGSAFGFFQDGSLTTKDYFAKKKDLTKADTQLPALGRHGRRSDRPGQDPLLLQPRAVRDRSAEHDRDPGAARPERPADHAGPRVEHHHPRRSPDQPQQHLQRPLAARDVAADEPDHSAECQPGRDRRAAREESDVDQTLAANINSVLSNTKVNTLRLTWTRENVAFANSCFNANGRDLSQVRADARLPGLSPISRTTPAQSRINDGIQLDETLAWFLPGKHGDHDLKVGAQYQYSGADNENQGNLNGTFAFGRSNAPFNAADPRTYPDRLTIRVGGPSTFFEKAHYVSAFVQDKWRVNQRLTLSLGLRYDLEIIPIPETDDPLVDDLPGRQEQLPAARRPHLRPRRRHEPRARRIRALLRQDALRADRRPLHRHAVHLVVHGELPDGGGRSRGRATASSRPIRSSSTARRSTARCSNSSSPADSCSATPARAGTMPIARTPYTDQLTAGYERQLADNMAVSADYVHAFSRDLLMSLDLNPGCARRRR